MVPIGGPGGTGGPAPGSARCPPSTQAIALWCRLAPGRFVRRWEVASSVPTRVPWRGPRRVAWRGPRRVAWRGPRRVAWGRVRRAAFAEMCTQNNKPLISGGSRPRINFGTIPQACTTAHAGGSYPPAANRVCTTDWRRPTSQPEARQSPVCCSWCTSCCGRPCCLAVGSPSTARSHCFTCGAQPVRPWGP